MYFSHDGMSIIYQILGIVLALSDTVQKIKDWKQECLRLNGKDDEMIILPFDDR